jgi:hypothetical protein
MNKQKNRILLSFFVVNSLFFSSLVADETAFQASLKKVSFSLAQLNGVLLSYGSPKDQINENKEEKLISGFTYYNNDLAKEASIISGGVVNEFSNTWKNMQNIGEDISSFFVTKAPIVTLSNREVYPNDSKALKESKILLNSILKNTNTEYADGSKYKILEENINGKNSFMGIELDLLQSREIFKSCQKGGNKKTLDLGVSGLVGIIDNLNKELLKWEQKQKTMLLNNLATLEANMQATISEEAIAEYVMSSTIFSMAAGYCVLAKDNPLNANFIPTLISSIKKTLSDKTIPEKQREVITSSNIKDILKNTFGNVISTAGGTAGIPLPGGANLVYEVAVKEKTAPQVAEQQAANANQNESKYKTCVNETRANIIMAFSEVFGMLSSKISYKGAAIESCNKAKLEENMFKEYQTVKEIKDDKKEKSIVQSMADYYGKNILSPIDSATITLDNSLNFFKRAKVINNKSYNIENYSLLSADLRNQLRQSKKYSDNLNYNEEVANTINLFVAMKYRTKHALELINKLNSFKSQEEKANMIFIIKTIYNIVIKTIVTEEEFLEIFDKKNSLSFYDDIIDLSKKLKLVEKEYLVGQDLSNGSKLSNTDLFKQIQLTTIPKAFQLNETNELADFFYYGNANYLFLNMVNCLYQPNIVYNDEDMGVELVKDNSKDYKLSDRCTYILKEDSVFNVEDQIKSKEEKDKVLNYTKLKGYYNDVATEAIIQSLILDLSRLTYLFTFNYSEDVLENMRIINEEKYNEYLNSKEFTVEEALEKNNEYDYCTTMILDLDDEFLNKENKKYVTYEGNSAIINEIKTNKDYINRICRTYEKDALTKEIKIKDFEYNNKMYKYPYLLNLFEFLESYPYFSSMIIVDSEEE